jgi:DNA polymerase V
MYALVDCNNFYVSCERVFRPDLIGKPVVVLSNNDGCIISRSDEAKALGIAMGAPEFQVREQLRQQGVTVFSSNYALYGDLSARVMKILEAFTPHIEVYSIDEAFLSFKGFSGLDFELTGKQMRDRIGHWLGIPVCVGIAPTKVLAKLANKIARKKKSGVCVIDTEEKRIKTLEWSKIESVWGIGRRLAKKMSDHGIATAMDFTKPGHLPWIKSQMGVTGLRMARELNGEPVLALEFPSDKKSIATTRSFPKKLTEFDLLRERVSTFAAVCAEKLRAQHLCCHTICVTLGVMGNGPGHSRRFFHDAVTLPYATQSTLTLTREANRMLRELYGRHGGTAFFKAGVVVTQLIRESEKQFRLFEEENPKYQALMTAIDRVNGKIGSRKIRLATQNEPTWDMKQDWRSPGYTTNPKQLLVVNCK